MNGYEARKQKKRDAIKQAALELFSQYGIKKVSVAEVAKKAGVNPVTIYNHFHNKSLLIRVVVQDFIANEWKKSSQILQTDQPFLEKLQQLVSAKIEWARLNDSALLGSALVEDETTNELVRAFFEKEVNPALTDFIREGQKSGAVRKDLSIAAISTYLDMFTSLSRTHPQLFTDKNRLTKSTREIWSLFLHGLVGQKPDRANPMRT
jgi:AcrR family transcriptional regulator